MALLHDSVGFKKLDVRLIERNVARGVLTADELKQSISQLPDDSENAEWISLDTLSGESGDSDSNSSHSH